MMIAELSDFLNKVPGQIKPKSVFCLSVDSKVLSYLYLFVFVVILTNSSSAQTSNVDSLQNELSVTTEESERIPLLNELSRSLIDLDPIQSLDKAREALRLSRITNNKKEEVSAILNIGVLIYDSRESRDSALIYFIKGEQLAEEHGFRRLQCDHLMRLANYYRYNEIDSSKTVDLLLKSVEVSKEVGYHYGTARSYAKLASFYTRFRGVQLCDDYLESSASYYLKLENGKEEIAHYYDEVGNKIWDFYPRKAMELFLEGLKYSESYPNLKVSLGKVYISINEPKKALKQLKEALVILETTLYPRIKGVAIAKKAEVYLQLKDYKAALEACDEGIEFLTPVSVATQTAMPALYRTKGVLMEIENRDKAAEEYFKKSISEGHRLNIPFDALNSSIYLGNFYSSRNDNQGSEYCQYALNAAKEYNFTSLEIAACDCLYEFSKKTQNYSGALNYFEQKNQLSDSLSTLKVQYALEINNRIAEKNKELAQESYLNEIKEEQLKYQLGISKLLSVSSVIGLLFIGFLLFGIRRIRRQNSEIVKNRAELVSANDELARSNEELERFAHVASHDLKSPLKTIIAFSGLLRKKLQNDVGDSAKEYLNYIEKSGTRMSSLIDDILDYSKLSSKDSNDKQVISLNEVVNEISQMIQNDTDVKMFKIEASGLPDVNWNYSKIFLLFKNFIENGLKYNESENPMVKLYCTRVDNINCIHIEDNGIGIEPEYFEKIFTMFHRLHAQDKYEGTGLGLATCKKIVDEFNGRIEVESQVGMGTSFKVLLPSYLIAE